jgi:nucleoside-diphosphate-sugar epimerase
VFASTCSVYGACDEMIDERSIVRPLSLYGHTKLASERILREMADDRFFSTILRFATIYGLSGRTRLDLVVNLLAARAKIDGEITICGGGQWRPFLHVEDAADAIALVLTAPRSLVANQVFNVGSSDENYTIAAIGEMVRQQVVGARVIVDETQVDTRNYRVDFRKIRHTLGFEPVWSVEDGIHQVLEAIAAGEITDYQDPQYSNVKHLSEAGTDHLARDNWARELIKDVSGG